jgi:hypothetical protein
MDGTRSVSTDMLAGSTNTCSCWVLMVILSATICWKYNRPSLNLGVFLPVMTGKKTFSAQPPIWVLMVILSATICWKYNRPSLNLGVFLPVMTGKKTFSAQPPIPEPCCFFAGHDRQKYNYHLNKTLMKHFFLYQTGLETSKDWSHLLDFIAAMLQILLLPSRTSQKKRITSCLI